MHARFAGFIATMLASPGRRALYTTFASGLSLPPDVMVERLGHGAVRGEWLTALGSRYDRLLLYLHGGSHTNASAGDYRHLTTGLAEALRATVLALDYRLAPESPFPAAIDDAVAAYRMLLEQNVSPESIVVAGDLAGGGLALALLLSLQDRDLPLPAAAG